MNNNIESEELTQDELEELSQNEFELSIYNINNHYDIIDKSDETLVKYMVVLTRNINVFLALGEHDNMESLDVDENTYVKIADLSKISYEIRRIIHIEIINRQLRIGRDNAISTNYQELYDKYSEEFMQKKSFEGW